MKSKSKTRWKGLQGWEEMMLGLIGLVVAGWMVGWSHGRGKLDLAFTTLTSTHPYLPSLLHAVSGSLALLLVHLQFFPYTPLRAHHATVGRIATSLVVFMLVPTAFWMLPTLSNGVWGITHAIYARFVWKVAGTAWQMGGFDGVGLKGPEHIRKARLLRAQLMTFVWARVFLHVVSLVCWAGGLGKGWRDVGYTLAVVASGWEAAYVSANWEFVDRWRERLWWGRDAIAAMTKESMMAVQIAKSTVASSVTAMWTHPIPLPEPLPAILSFPVMLQIDEMKWRWWVGGSLAKKVE
ncbi:hypothetical protein HK097_010855 [Rhizophlyctis rosea]|uniref:Uncharacterized protein n=1 Tax=Rhizophlyctis rosea TaxID=64517 RepID=A0AAD5X3G8_9FUNG|nr:hypothetical protein HK097_010855 [Rhizophlyctis rosea]